MKTCTKSPKPGCNPSDLATAGASRLKKTKDIIMNYTDALSLTAKATANLQDHDGNMSEAEVVVHVSALHLALKAIADHNSVELPPLT